MSPDPSDRLRSPFVLAVTGLVLVVLLAGILAHAGEQAPAAGATRARLPHRAGPRTSPVAAYLAAAPTPLRRRPQLPGGGYEVFGRHRFLVAYYGTARTAAMGVLGASAPDVMDRRLRRAAAPFREPGERIQPVYELIVTIADPAPGPDHVYSHDISRPLVEEYLHAAHRHHALLLLDLQTGRAPFPVVARRWAWALADPWVGLALDPEWRMGPGQVPGRVIGSVRAAEVNATSRWLSALVRRHDLPQKLFVLHQFRRSMLPDLGRVVPRTGLAMVQHADGFGTRREKLATYHAIARPRRFRQGFKLFYRWDRNRFTPREVRRIRPAVSFVSYQ